MDPTTGRGPTSGPSDRRVQLPLRGGQRRTCVSSIIPARRFASSLIASAAIRHHVQHGKLDVVRPQRPRAQLRGVDAWTVVLARACAAVAVAVERHGVAATDAVAFTLDEIGVGNFGVAEARDQRTRPARVVRQGRDPLNKPKEREITASPFLWCHGRPTVNPLHAARRWRFGGGSVAVRWREAPRLLFPDRYG